MRFLSVLLFSLFFIGCAIAQDNQKLLDEEAEIFDSLSSQNINLNQYKDFILKDKMILREFTFQGKPPTFLPMDVIDMSNLRRKFSVRGERNTCDMLLLAYAPILDKSTINNPRRHVNVKSQFIGGICTGYPGIRWLDSVNVMWTN